MRVSPTMSEYQYYEFQAIDRPLTREEMAPYQVEGALKVSATGFHLILRFSLDTDSGEYDEDEDNDDLLTTLLPILRALAVRDFRALYLGGLAGLLNGLIGQVFGSWESERVSTASRVSSARPSQAMKMTSCRQPVWPRCQRWRSALRVISPLPSGMLSCGPLPGGSHVTL